MCLFFSFSFSPSLVAEMTWTILCRSKNPPTSQHSHTHLRNPPWREANNSVMVTLSNHKHPSSRKQQTVRSATHCNCVQCSHPSHPRSHPPHHRPSVKRCSVHCCRQTGQPGMFCWRLLSHTKMDTCHFLTVAEKLDIWHSKSRGNYTEGLVIWWSKSQRK